MKNTFENRVMMFDQLSKCSSNVFLGTHLFPHASCWRCCCCTATTSNSICVAGPVNLTYNVSHLSYSKRRYRQGRLILLLLSSRVYKAGNIIHTNRGIKKLRRCDGDTRQAEPEEPLPVWPCLRFGLFLSCTNLLPAAIRLSTGTT